MSRFTRTTAKFVETALALPGRRPSEYRAVRRCSGQLFRQARAGVDRHHAVFVQANPPAEEQDRCIRRRRARGGPAGRGSRLRAAEREDALTFEEEVALFGIEVEARQVHLQIVIFDLREIGRHVKSAVMRCATPH